MRAALRRCVPLLAVLTSACGGSAAPGDDSLGGFGLARQIAGESYGGAPFAEPATFVVAPNGCHTLDVDGVAHAVIWPLEATGPDPATVVVDGLTVHDGDRLDVRGRAVAAAALPGGADGYWGNLMTFCDLPDPVLVVDDLREVAP